MADWDQIRAVREVLHIPVIANGNIKTLQDVNSCLEYTGCAGVMSAYGLLKDPTLFNEPAISMSAFDLARAYLSICEEFEPPLLQMICDHLLAFLVDELSFGPQDVVHALHRPDWYEGLGLEQFRMVVCLVEQRSHGQQVQLSLKQIKRAHKKKRRNERRRQTKQTQTK